MYLGDTEIAKAYLGEDLVFQNGGGPTPPPAGLVYYDRLVFDGTAYIETDIVPPENASIRIPLGNETTKGAQRLFMWGGTNSAAFGAMLNSETTSSIRMWSAYYGQSAYVSKSTSSSRLNFSTARYTFFLTPSRWGWGSTAVSFTKGGETPSSALILGSNLGKSGTPYTGTMGIVRIYGSDAQNATSASDLVDNYTPVYTLYPCTYNNVAGMWCVETSTFYGNTAQSGTLSVSNDS